jgi:putative acetyltransferase
VGHLLRLAKSSDAPICAAIVNSWIDNTKWMPRIDSPDLITQMIKDGIPIREFWVIGDPVLGYLSFNVEAQQIMGLYGASGYRPRKGSFGAGQIGEILY